jgi:hypothetical protein
MSSSQAAHWDCLLCTLCRLGAWYSCRVPRVHDLQRNIIKERDHKCVYFRGTRRDRPPLANQRVARAYKAIVFSCIRHALVVDSRGSRLLGEPFPAIADNPSGRRSEHAVALDGRVVLRIADLGPRYGPAGTMTLLKSKTVAIAARRISTSVFDSCARVSWNVTATGWLTRALMPSSGLSEAACSPASENRPRDQITR